MRSAVLRAWGPLLWLAGPPGQLLALVGFILLMAGFSRLVWWWLTRPYDQEDDDRDH